MQTVKAGLAFGGPSNPVDRRGSASTDYAQKTAIRTPMIEIERLRANARRCTELAKLATEKVTVDMLTKLAKTYAERADALEVARTLAKCLYLDDAE